MQMMAHRLGCRRSAGQPPAQDPSPQPFFSLCSLARRPPPHAHTHRDPSTQTYQRKRNRRPDPVLVAPTHARAALPLTGVPKKSRPPPA